MATTEATRSGTASGPMPLTDNQSPAISSAPKRPRPSRSLAGSPATRIRTPRQPDRHEGALHLRRPAGAGDPGQLAVEPQDLVRREPALVPEELRQVADAPAGRRPPRRSPQDPGAPRGGARQAQEQLDRG